MFEGGEFFAPPHGEVTASIPAPAKDVSAPAKTDEEYESTVGVKAAIDNGKMVPVTGVNGQSFVATGVAGKKDGKVTFTFVKAYVGDYDYATRQTPRQTSTNEDPGSLVARRARDARMLRSISEGPAHHDR